MQNQTELLQILFIFIGCIILTFSISFYTFSNKFTQRKSEVEELEPIRFNISKIPFFVYTCAISIPIGMAIGGGFLFHILEGMDSILFLLYIMLLFISACSSTFLTWFIPLFLVTDKHLYVYPFFGLSSKYKKYELEKLQWKEDSLHFYLYDGDKQLRCSSSLAIYGTKGNQAILELIKSTSPHKEEK